MAGGVYGSSKSSKSSKRSLKERLADDESRESSGSKGSSDQNSGNGSGHSNLEGRSDSSSAHGNVWAINFQEVDLGGLVATGSFGIVHTGTYHGRNVAVKFLLFPESGSEEDSNRLKRSFRQEVAVWHKLSHPNVVEFIGAYIDPPKWAIVTEFCEGGTLKGLLSRLHPRKPSVKQIVNLALDIARGMQYLHKRDIIHRDLKSANLLLTKSGSVKVADFGLARTEAQDHANMTAETGTVRWMAPEVIDHRPYSRKVDVYSFGIVLWEICTCLSPFEGYPFVKLVHDVVAENLRPPTNDCPPALAKIMSQCWQANPDARPDFDEVVKDLEALHAKHCKKSRHEDILPLSSSKVSDASIPQMHKAALGSTELSSDGSKSRDGLPQTNPDTVEWKKVKIVEPESQPGCGCSIM